MTLTTFQLDKGPSVTDIFTILGVPKEPPCCQLIILNANRRWSGDSCVLGLGHHHSLGSHILCILSPNRSVVKLRMRMSLIITDHAACNSLAFAPVSVSVSISTFNHFLWSSVSKRTPPLT